MSKSKTSNIQLFQYEGTPVRTVVQDGEVWFVAKDVCDVLGLDNPTEAIKSLDDDERMTLRNSEGHSGQRGGAQLLNVISEPGLYALVFRSNKAEAKAFARWVRHEVLPQIAHAGSFSEHCELAPSLDAETMRKLVADRSNLSARKDFWQSLLKALQPIEAIIFKTARGHGWYDMPAYTEDDNDDIGLLRSILSTAKELINNKGRALEQKERTLECVMKF